MRVLVLVAYVFAGCGAVPPLAPAAASPVVEDEPQKRRPKPAEEAAEAKRGLDDLRCYLLHQKEAREGRAPKEWKQPSMAEYEESDDPCTLLPGFEDPKKKERE